MQANLNSGSSLRSFLPFYGLAPYGLYIENHQLSQPLGVAVMVGGIPGIIQRQHGVEVAGGRVQRSFYDAHRWCARSGLDALPFSVVAQKARAAADEA